MGSKGSAPSAPDPTNTADQQIRVNQATIDQLTNANRFNQVGPYGSQNWAKDPTTGTWTQTTTEDPRLTQQNDQQIINTDLRLGTAGNATQRLLNNGTYGSALDTSQLPGITSHVDGAQMVGDIDPATLPQLSNTIAGGDQSSLQQAQNSVYGQMKSRLDPQWAQQQNDLQTQLNDEGVPQGSDAWNKAMDQFGRSKTDAYQSANNAAVQAGNDLEGQQFQEHATQGQFANSANNQAFQQLLSRAGFSNTAQAQDFAQQLSNAGLGNSANAQSLQDLITGRMAPINEVNALTSGTSPQSPSFSTSGQSNITPQGAPDMGQLYGQNYQGQLNSYNANVGNSNATTGAVASVAAAALMAF